MFGIGFGTSSVSRDLQDNAAIIAPLMVPASFALLAGQPLSDTVNWAVI